MSESPVLRVEDVSVVIGGQLILDSVSIDILSGHLTLLRGRSGAGKSTLINALMGLVPLESGRVSLGSVDLLTGTKRELTALRRSVGLVYQDPLLLGDLTVGENVVWMARLRGLSRSAAEMATLEALRLVHIENLANRQIHYLSGGESQRVSVARAIVGDTQILLADEPTSALDTDNSNHLAALLDDLASSRKIPVLVASHDPLLVRFAHSVITISDGKIVNEC